MSFPFLEKKESTVAVHPDRIIKRKPDEEKEYDPMEAAAEDLCHAIESKDYKTIAEALRSAFHLADLEPHKEGPHE